MPRIRFILRELCSRAILELLEAADSCDFQRVRQVTERTAPLYEFANFCARNRGRDPWILPPFTSGHIYVGVMKAAMEMLGLAGGPVRGPGDDLTEDERTLLGKTREDVGLLTTSRASNRAAPS